MNKKIIDVATEKQEASGGLLDDVMSVMTLGLMDGSKSEGFTTTVTYDDGTVDTGFGYTKEDSIKSATNNT